MASQVKVLSMNCVKSITKAKGRICDCGILWNEAPIIAVIELKGGKSDVNVNKSVKQLQSGLKVLDRQLSGQQVDDFFPILLYRGKRDPTPALSNRRVTFRQDSRRVIAKPCGTDLAAVVGQASGRSRRRRRSRLGSRR